MRRFALLILLPVVLASVILLTTFVGAQKQNTGDIPLPPADRDMNLIAGSAVPVDVIPLTPADIASVVGTDDCTDANQFPFDYENGILSLGSPTDVSAFTQDATDPSLASCINGQFTDSQGYRSAWFKVVAPVNGTLIAEAKTNSDYKRNYDTVIAIYADLTADNTCNNLSLRNCNDDVNGILSKASTPVSYNQTYYILVVDRNPASSGQTLLDIEVTIDTGSGQNGDNDLGNPNGDWYVSDTLLEEFISRHTVVVSGTDVYVIGGQTSLGEAPVRTGQIYRFDASGESLTDLDELAKMPASAGFNGEGYSNADAMLVGDEIHYFSGYIGSPAEYDDEHWVYTISSDRWDTYAELYPTALTLSETTGMAEPLAYTALAPYIDGSVEGFYITGGLTGEFLSSDTPLADTVAPNSRFFRYLYDTDNNANPIWQELTSMNRERYAHTAATIISDTVAHVCVVGGLGLNVISGTTSNVLIEDGECYNPNTGMWDSTAVGSLNNYRYMAHSAVSPDGTWYVYGGINENGDHVAEVEYFDSATGNWIELAPNYNLDEPVLAWPRGGFVGYDLWVFGGEQLGNLAVGEIKAKTFPFNFTPTDYVYLPLVSKTTTGLSFASAIPIALDTDFDDTFDGIGDVYNVYQFTTDTAGTYTVTMSNQANLADGDLLVYDPNKNIIDISQNIGTTDESLKLIDLDADTTYYILLARSSPPPNLEHLGNFILHVESPN